jgi:hypothetical protein
VPAAQSLREVLTSVPAGVIASLADFAQVCRGDMHIWEPVVSDLRQWYLCDRLDRPAAFFYGALSEQVRPDLARKLFARLQAISQPD